MHCLFIYIATKISNVTKPNLPEWDYDKRYFVPLTPPNDELTDDMKKQVEFYSLRDEKFQILHKRAIHRITLFLACYLNAPTEFCPMSELDEYSPKQTTKKKSQLCIGDSVKAVEHLSHICGTSASLIIGGHKGSMSVNGKSNDQIPHKDIGSVIIDGVEYASSSNPNLHDKLKPFTVHIPKGISYLRP